MGQTHGIQIKITKYVPSNQTKKSPITVVFRAMFELNQVFEFCWVSLESTQLFIHSNKKDISLSCLGHGSNGNEEDGSRPPSRPGHSGASSTGHGSVGSKTLLDWINQAGNNSLESVADNCYR